MYNGGNISSADRNRAVSALTKGVFMKPYELTVLVHPDGKKRMAYAIKGQEHALYYFFEVELPVSAPAKINSALGISDEVMRMLLVKVDERKVKIQMKKKERYEKAVAAGRVEEGEKKEESKEESKEA